MATLRPCSGKYIAASTIEWVEVANSLTPPDGNGTSDNSQDRKTFPPSADIRPPAVHGSAAGRGSGETFALPVPKPFAGCEEIRHRVTVVDEAEVEAVLPTRSRLPSSV